MVTVSAQIAAALSAHVTDAFGVMGNGNAYFIDALINQCNIAYTAMRHESGTVVAADAYYRSGGGIAIATATYGAGFTNLLTPLAEAVMAKTPMLVVVGDQPSKGPRPWDVQQTELGLAVGAKVLTLSVDDCRDGQSVAAFAVAAVSLARATCTPVVVQIPYDLGLRQVDRASEIPLVEGRESLSEPDVAAMVEALANAKRPLLLGGRGAWLANAGQALDQIATLLGAPTATTALGRGLFTNGQFDLGVAGGFGAGDAMAVIAEADVVAVFGASLNQFTRRFGTLFGPEAAVFQVDLEPGPVGIPVRGDALAAATGVLAVLQERGVSSTGWRDSLDIPALRQRAAGEDLAADGRLDPRSVALLIASEMPTDRIVVSDGGHHIGWTNMYWPVASPERMVMVGTAYQSIGLGFPSVAGAAMARPISTIVLSTGDGGGLMALADLESAVRVAAGRGLAIVWNDAAYGAEVNVYGRRGLRREAMDIPEVDFAALARSFGADGVVIRELGDLKVLTRWTETPSHDRRFLLLDLRISVDVVAPFQEEIFQLG